eukprot:15108016-Heterocapsa_arctica.AAC.1
MRICLVQALCTCAPSRQPGAGLAGLARGARLRARSAAANRGRENSAARGRLRAETKAGDCWLPSVGRRLLRLDS